ncbi:unnamed protein product [Rotaria magnacalcarata]|uniref:Uncharacterized protein n=1 Tax=Rotaria magnacalcarata TaxID=392030 RepID=A0A815W1C0_9BILA|nr:unnamed protein product [Rotaria magnacalcarata]
MSDINTLSSRPLLKISPHRISSPLSNATIEENNVLTHELSESQKQSSSTNTDVDPDMLAVLYFGQSDSSLRTALIKNVTTQDIALILFSKQEQLWHWLDTTSSVRNVFVIIQANMNIAYILYRIHAYFSVRSIFLRCKTNELNSFKELRTFYIKINGIYDEDARILIKLVIELALFSEEKGDQDRENRNNELGAQRNYQRALNLCALVRTL